MIIKKLLELITNPATKRLSTSDSVLVGAFIVSSTTLIYLSVTGRVDSVLYTAYLTAWVVQCQASKHAAITRDKIIKNSESPND